MPAGDSEPEQSSHKSSSRSLDRLTAGADSTESPSLSPLLLKAAEFSHTYVLCMAGLLGGGDGGGVSVQGEL